MKWKAMFWNVLWLWKYDYCVLYAPACYILPSGKKKMYDVIQETINQDFPPFVAKLFGYVANPGLIIPAILLMV